MDLLKCSLKIILEINYDTVVCYVIWWEHTTLTLNTLLGICSHPDLLLIYSFRRTWTNKKHHHINYHSVLLPTFWFSIAVRSRSPCVRVLPYDLMAISMSDIACFSYIWPNCGHYFYSIVVMSVVWNSVSCR